MATYSCSQCHFHWNAPEPAPACPRCHAEAGLEVQHAPSKAMLWFAGSLAFALLLAVTGSVLARLG